MLIWYKYAVLRPSLFWDVKRSMSVVYRRFGTACLFHIQLQVVQNYQHKLRNVPEERRSQIQRGRRLKSRIPLLS